MVHDLTHTYLHHCPAKRYLKLCTYIKPMFIFVGSPDLFWLWKRDWMGVLCNSHSFCVGCHQMSGGYWHPFELAMASRGRFRQDFILRQNYIFEIRMFRGLKWCITCFCPFMFNLSLAQRHYMIFKHEIFTWDQAFSWSLRKRNAEKCKFYQNRTTFRGCSWPSKF